MSTSGWYPDPEDASSLRFWDGERWTNQTASAAHTEAGPKATYWQRYLKRWKYTFLIVTLLAVVGQAVRPSVPSAHNGIGLVGFAVGTGAIWATVLTVAIAVFPAKPGYGKPTP